MKSYENIILTFKEKYLLFFLRFKHKAVDSYFNGSFYTLIEYQLIKRNYKSKRSESGASIPDGTYSLTDKYFRYCAYRRQKFFDSKLWPLIISVVASIITSTITTQLLWLSKQQWWAYISFFFCKAFGRMLLRLLKYRIVQGDCHFSSLSHLTLFVVVRLWQFFYMNIFHILRQKNFPYSYSK